MLRIVALLIGALAGIVASLFLGLGGLEVTAKSLIGANLASLAQFGLILIAAGFMLGAGVSLSAPRSGAALLLLAAGTWAVGAVFVGGVPVNLLHFGPTALGIIAFVLALVASFLTPRRNADYFPSPSLRDPYDVAPSNGRYREQVAAMEVPPPSLGGMAERDLIPGRLNGGGLDHRRRGRAEPEEPVFRELPEDDEPSGFARFGRTAASILSFLLYAGAAGAVALLLFNLNQDGSNAAVVATGPSQPSSSSVEPAASSSRVSSASQAPAPVIASSSLPPPAPSSSEPAPAAATASSGPTLNDGVVVAGNNATQPRVVGGPPPTTAAEAPPSAEDLPATSSSELAATAEPAEGAIDPTKVAPAPAMMSPELAARRKAGTAAPVLATPPANSDL